MLFYEEFCSLPLASSIFSNILCISRGGRGMASDVSSTEAVEPDDEKEEGELSLEDVSSSEEQQPYKFPPRAFGQCPHCLSTKRCHPWCRSLTYNGYYRAETQYPVVKDVGLQGKENRKKQQSTKLPSDLSSISPSSSSTLQEKNDVELAAALSSDLVPISSDSDMELVGLYDDSKRRKRRKLLKKSKKKKREKSPSSCLDLALSIKDSIHKVETTGPVLLPRKDSSSTSHIKPHRHHSPDRKKVCFVKSSSPVRKHRRSPPVTRSHTSSILVAVKRRQRPPAPRRSPSPRHRSKTSTKKPIPVVHSVVDDALKDLPSPGGNVTKLLKKVRQLEPFSSRSKEKGSSLKDKLSNIIKTKAKPDNLKEKAESKVEKDENKVESKGKKESDAKEKDELAEEEKRVDSSEKLEDIIKDAPKEANDGKSTDKSAISVEPKSTAEANDGKSTEKSAICAEPKSSAEASTTPPDHESGSKNEETKNPCDGNPPKNEQVSISNIDEVVVETVAEHSSPKLPEAAQETLNAVHEQIDTHKSEDSDPEMIEEPPPPESQNLPNFIMDDNDEDLELRMIALRSAVLKKHRTRIQSGKVKRKRAQLQNSGSSSPAAVPRIESPFTSSFVEDFPLLAEVCRPESPADLKQDIYCSEDMELDSDMELGAMSDVDESQSPYSPTDDVASLLLDQDETAKNLDVSLYTPSKPTETPRSVSSPSTKPRPGHLDGSFLEEVVQESRPYSPTDVTIFDPDLPGLHPSAAEPTTAPVPPPPPPPPGALGMFGQPLILGCPAALLNPFVDPVAVHMVSSFPALHQTCSPMMVPAPAGPLFAFPSTPVPQVEVVPVEQCPAQPAPEPEPQIEPALSDDFGETDLDGSPLVPMDTKDFGSSSSTKWALLDEPLYIKALDEPPSLVPSTVLRGHKQLLKQATLKRLQQQASHPRRESPQSLFKSAKMTPVAAAEVQLGSKPASTGGLLFKPLKLQPMPKRSAPITVAPVFAEAASPDDEVAEVLQSRLDTLASSDRSSMTPSPRPGGRYRRRRGSLKKTNERWQELHSRALQEKNAKQRVERERQCTPILEEDEEALREKLLASLKKKKEMAAAAAAKQASVCEENLPEQKQQLDTTTSFKRAATTPPPTERIVRKTVKRANFIPASTKVVNNAKRFQNQLQQRKLIQQKLTLTVSKLGNVTKKVEVANLEVPQTDEGVKRVLFTLDDDSDSDNENVPPVNPPKHRPILEIPTTDFEKSVDQFLKNVRQQHEQAVESCTEDQAVTEIVPKTLEEKIGTVSIPSTSPTVKSDIADQLVNIKVVSAQKAASSPTHPLEGNVAHKTLPTQVHNGLKSNVSNANAVNKGKDCPASNILLVPSEIRPINGTAAVTGEKTEPTNSVPSSEKNSTKKSITSSSIKPVGALINAASTSTPVLDPTTKPENEVTKSIVGKTVVTSTVVRTAATSVVTTARSNTATTVAAIKPTTAVRDLSSAKKKLGLGSIRVTPYESPLLSLTVTPQAVKHLPLPQQEEYRRLKQQIMEREKMRLMRAQELAASAKPAGTAAAASSTSLASRIRAASSSPKPGVAGSSASLVPTGSSTTQSSKQIPTAHLKTQSAALIESNTMKARTTNASVAAVSTKRVNSSVQVAKITPNNLEASRTGASRNPSTVANQNSSVESVPGKNQEDLLGKMTELLNNQKLKVSAVAQKVSKLRILTKDQMNNRRRTPDREPPNLLTEHVSIDPEKHHHAKRLPLLRILTKDQINQRILNKEISAYDTTAHIPSRNKNHRIVDSENTENGMKSLCPGSNSQNLAKAIENLSSNIYQPHDSWSDFKQKVNEEVQNFIDLPADNQKELLSVCEEKLIVKRHAVLDDITEMSGNLRQWEVEKDVQESLALEIQKLEEQLKVAEEKMQQQKNKLSVIQPKISKYHEKINSGRKECFRLSKICSKLGQQTEGPSYLVPSAGAELLTNRIKEVADHSQKLKSRKTVTKSSIEVRDSSKTDADRTEDGRVNSSPKPSPLSRSLNPGTETPATSLIPDNTDSDKENRTSIRDPDPAEKQVTDGNNVNMSADDNNPNLNRSDHGEDMEVSPDAEETVDKDEKKFSILDLKVKVKTEEVIPRQSLEDSKLSISNTVKTEQLSDECKPSIVPTADEAQSIKTEEQNNSEMPQSIPMDVENDGDACSNQTLHDDCSVPMNSQSSDLRSESTPICGVNLLHTNASTNDAVTELSPTSVNDSNAMIVQPSNHTIETEVHECPKSSYVQGAEVGNENTPDEVDKESSCNQSSSSLSHNTPIPNSSDSVNELHAVEIHASSNLDSSLNDGSIAIGENRPSNSNSEEMNEENRQNISQDGKENSPNLLVQDTKNVSPTTVSSAITKENDQQSLLDSSSKFIESQDNLHNHEVKNSKSEDEMASHNSETENEPSEEPSRTDQSCINSKPVGESVETSSSDVENLPTEHDQSLIAVTLRGVPNTIQNHAQKISQSPKKVSSPGNDLDESVVEITAQCSDVNNQPRNSSECSDIDNKSDTVSVAVDIAHNVTEQTLDPQGIGNSIEVVDSDGMNSNEEYLPPPISTTSELQLLDDALLMENERLENFYLQKSMDDIINGRNEESIFDSNPFQVSDVSCAEDSTFMEEIALLELANEIEVPEGIMQNQKSSSDINDFPDEIMQDPKSNAEANNGSNEIMQDPKPSAGVNSGPDKNTYDPKVPADVNGVDEKLMQDPKSHAEANNGSNEIMQDPKSSADANSGPDKIAHDPKASADVNDVPEETMQDPKPSADANSASDTITHDSKVSADVNDVPKKIVQDPKPFADAKDSYDEITYDPEASADVNDVPEETMQDPKPSADANSGSDTVTRDLNASADVNDVSKKIVQDPKPFADANNGSGGIAQDPEICADDPDRVVQNSEPSMNANENSVATTQDPETSAVASSAQKQQEQAQVIDSLLKKYKVQRKSLIKPYESVLELIRAPKNDKPDGILCPFELMGTCNDGDCQYIHQSTSHC